MCLYLHWVASQTGHIARFTAHPHSTPTQHTDACTDLYGLTAFGLVCAVHTIDRHVAAMVWGDTVGLVPHVLAA